MAGLPDYPSAIADLRETGWAFVRTSRLPITRFQVLGERATGTNYLRYLLGNNTSLRRVEHYGWKHGFPQFQNALPRQMLAVSFRSLDAWLLSMYRKPWHVLPGDLNVTFSEWLRQPYRTVIDMPESMGNVIGEDRARGLTVQFDRHPIDGTVIPNPVQLRNLKNRAFLGLANRGCNVAFVRYETFSREPAAFLDAFVTAFGCRRAPELSVTDRRLGDMARKIKGKRREAAPVISDDDRAFIAAELDHEVEGILGYEGGAAASSLARATA